jgi:hypothetical protein
MLDLHPLALPFLIGCVLAVFVGIAFVAWLDRR